MTTETETARAKLMSDIDQLRVVDKLGRWQSSEMAAALVVDSIDRLIAAARAEGRAESAEDNAALASVASQLLEVSSRPPPPRKD
jgi:hypothetical protein